MELYKSIVSIVVVTVLLYSTCDSNKYDGIHRLIRVRRELAQLNGTEYLKVMRNLSQFNVDFWQEISDHRPIDLCVSPNEFLSLQDYLHLNQITPEMLLEDVGIFIKQQFQEMFKKRNGTMHWETYQDYATIQRYLNKLQMRFSKSVRIYAYGVTSEGRTLQVVKIGRKGSNCQTKKKLAFFIAAGMHAREWITGAAITWVMNELLTNPEYTEIVESVDIYFVPVANPDGYEYTQNDDRLWLKTRSKNLQSHQNCKGVDATKNFPYKWENTSKPGTMKPCDKSYKGPAPLSEPEAYGIHNFIWEMRTLGVQWVSYYTIHSYSRTWLLPWAWTTEPPANYAELLHYGKIGADAIKAVHGMEFEVGSDAVLLSPGGSTDSDWAYSTGIFKYSQLVEMRGNEGFGFLLPSDQIIPAGEETIQAVVAQAMYVVECMKNSSLN